jgi:hypothetical protein
VSFELASVPSPAHDKDGAGPGIPVVQVRGEIDAALTAR